MMDLLKKPFVHQSFIISNTAFSSSFKGRKDMICHNRSNWFLKPSIVKEGCIRKCVSPKFVRVVMATTDIMSHTNVKALVSVKQSDGGIINNIVTDIVGNSHLVLELVSADLHPKTKSEKETIKAHAHETQKNENDVQFETTFKLPADFGNVGAVLVQNEHDKEIFLNNIVLDGFPNGPIHLSCQSWIQPNHSDSPTERVFFTNKMYLPSQTPSGLTKLRENELKELRGNGEGERKKSDRIYDYDVYNDLGDPDISTELKRPVLGSTKQYPYPRRCRTGQTHSDVDQLYEKRSTLDFYVPRDESFSETKQTQFNASTISLGLTTIIQSLDSILTDLKLGFASFEDIDAIYKEGFQLPTLESNDSTILQKVIPKFIKDADDSKDILRFDTPESFKRDRFFWFSDVEFARETLAGANPYGIELVKE
ncbi:unnamed protein product [Lathyrus sativus]|nr:unnamed protein product [Lathyrus sativus]